jgi:hypothetical protein
MNKLNLIFHFSLVFFFVSSDLVLNHPDLCGTWIIPYEVLGSLLKLNWELLDNFKVAKFDNYFYLKSSKKIIDESLSYKYID